MSGLQIPGDIWAANRRHVQEFAEKSDCISCGEGMPENECNESKRECNHHCNHSWIHDKCCWCGEEF
jgi:hypothetical protein